MKVKIDGVLCTGHGRCYSLAPDVFEPDDEGFNLQRDTFVDVPEEREAATRLGVRACPEGAITVIES